VRNAARPVLFALFFTGLALAGCGDDSDGGGGDGEGRYDDPSDFARAGCGSGGPLDSIDPEGIWHLNTVFEGIDYGVSAMSIDADGGGLVAFVFGGEADDVRLSADDFFIRLEVNSNGEERVLTVDLCQVLEDGALAGKIASCFGDQCIVGEVEAFPVAPLDEPEAENMTLVAQWEGEGGSWGEDVALNVRHLGTVAYLVRASDGLRIVDLADPAQPVDLGHLPAPFAPDEYYNDIKVAEAGDGRVYAYLGSNLRGVVVADVTDAADPVEVATFPEPPIAGGQVNVHTLFTEGDRVYAAHTSIGGLEIYDVADPTSPVQLGTYVHPDASIAGGYVHDLFVQDGVAYLNYWNLGLVVVDTADDPADPTVLGVFDDYDRRTSHSNWVTEVGGRRVAIHGDEDFDAHVRVIDVDPASETAFQEIGSYQTRPAVSVHNIMAVGELALVAHYQDGLRVLDVSDPTSPVEVAHFATWPGTRPDYGQSFFEGVIGVDYDADRELVLLADSHRGLLVLTLDASSQRSSAASSSASSGSDGVASAERRRPTGGSAAWRRK
jgi:hypothetical protein